MPSMPQGSGQDGRGTKHTFDAGQLGTRDDEPTKLGARRLLMKKTDGELLADIRQSALAIRDASDEIPLVGSMTIAEMQRLESHANALAIYSRLLRQRIEAQDPSIQHLRKTLQEGE
jgi:hypothetical protein